MNGSSARMTRGALRQRPVRARGWHAIAPAASVVVTMALLAAACSSPSPSPTSSPSPTQTALPTPTGTPTALASPTPAPPLSLVVPAVHDDRVVRFTVSVQVPANAGGGITVTVTNLSNARIGEIVLRWPTGLNAVLFLAPFTSHPLTNALVQPWTKWVIGPGEQGEPAGTISLGYGPINPGTTLTIPLYVTRRAAGAVDFDLQFLAGETILSTEAGGPAWTRVRVP